MGAVCSLSPWAGAAKCVLLRAARPLPLPLVLAPSQPPEEVWGWPGEDGWRGRQCTWQKSSQFLCLATSHVHLRVQVKVRLDLCRAQEGLGLVLWVGEVLLFSILINIPKHHGEAVESSWIFLLFKGCHQFQT